MSNRTLPGQGRTRAGHCPRHAADTPDRHGHGTIDRVRVSGQAGANLETLTGMIDCRATGLRLTSPWKMNRGDRSGSTVATERYFPGGAVPGGTQTAKLHALQDF